MSVFSIQPADDYLTQPMFFGREVAVARYDKVKYPWIDKLTEKQAGQFWRPQEVELIIDQKDFKHNLTEHERHIYTSNLKRQILLDSVQGRAPVEAFLPICSLPELETFILTWSYFESIHNKSYTHILRNVFPDPALVLDNITDSQEIVDCAKDISFYYDQLIAANHDTTWRNTYEHKKALWLCLNAVNALEGIRFYVSFACSWNFAELKRMEGSAKIIKLIARDENIHLGFTQQALKTLPKDDPDFARIKIECEPVVDKIFADVITQEKRWANFLMKDGSMIGLNERLLCDYVDHISYKRMTAIGVSPLVKATINPLPWTAKWIAGSDVQVAPQEVELSSYVIGGVKQDVEPGRYQGFSL